MSAAHVALLTVAHVALLTVAHVALLTERVALAACASTAGPCAGRAFTGCMRCESTIAGAPALCTGD